MIELKNKTVTKAEIIQEVSSAIGLTKLETEAILNAVISKITKSLESKRRVEIRGFGTFGIKKREPRKARNPGTGEVVFLPERYVPVFKPSSLLKKNINDWFNGVKNALWKKKKKVPKKVWTIVKQSNEFSNKS